MRQATPNLDLAAITDHFSQQSDVLVAYLFGSVARAQADHLSDVDIAVLLKPGLEPEVSLERQLQLMVALDDFADREVQVTILNRTAPAMAFQVIRDGILLYERSRLDRVNFEVRTMKRYFDLKPMLEFHKRALLKRIQEVGLGRRKSGSPRTLEAAQRIQERLARAPKR